MFNSLDEQMKRNDAMSTSPRERWLHYASAVIVTVLVFSGLYAGMMLLE